MSLGQELKDFIQAFSVGSQLVPSKSEREDRQARTEYTRALTERLRREGQPGQLDPNMLDSASTFGQGALRVDDIYGSPPSGGTTRGGKAYQTGDPVATDMAPHQRALLNAIAGGESAGKYNIRYTPRGGELFEDFSRHPNIPEKSPHGPSTAAGRYQFLYSTWNRLGGGDFSPANQDHKAWQLAVQDYKARTGRDLDADLQANGLTPNIVKALSPTWAALKNHPDRIIATYDTSLARYRNSGPAQSASALPVDGPSDSQTSAQFVAPVSGIFNRRPPINAFHADRSGGSRLHSGYDWSAENGSAVVAPVDGKVLYTGDHQGYGKMFDMLGSDGRIYRLATHNSVSVRPNQTVRAGQQVGTIGRGHLHMEVIDRNSPIYDQMSRGGVFVKTSQHRGKPILTADMAQIFGLEPGTRVQAGRPITPRGNNHPDTAAAAVDDMAANDEAANDEATNDEATNDGTINDVAAIPVDDTPTSEGEVVRLREVNATDNQGGYAGSQEYGMQSPINADLRRMSPQEVRRNSRDAVQGGMLELAQTNGLDGPTAVNTPDREEGVRRYLTGADAAPPDLMRELRSRIDPEGAMSENEFQSQAFAFLWKYYNDRGEPQKARAAAASMIAFYRQQFGMWSSIAKAAAEGGDMDRATQALVRAYASIPDGGDLQIEKQGENYVLNYTLPDGKRQQKMLASPQQIGALAFKVTPTMFDEFIINAAGMEYKPERGPSEAFQRAVQLARDGEDIPAELYAGMSEKERDDIGPIITRYNEASRRGQGNLKDRGGEQVNSDVEGAWETHIQRHPELSIFYKGDGNANPGNQENLDSMAIAVITLPGNENLTAQQVVDAVGAILRVDPKDPAAPPPFKAQQKGGVYTIQFSGGPPVRMPGWAFDSLMESRQNLRTIALTELGKRGHRDDRDETTFGERSAIPLPELADPRTNAPTDRTPSALQEAIPTQERGGYQPLKDPTEGMTEDQMKVLELYPDMPIERVKALTYEQVQGLIRRAPRQN